MYLVIHLRLRHIITHKIKTHILSLKTKNHILSLKTKNSHIIAQNNLIMYATFPFVNIIKLIVSYVYIYND